MVTIIRMLIFDIQFSNLLATNGFSKPFGDSKSTEHSRFSGARRAAILKQGHDATFKVCRLSSADGERSSAGLNDTPGR